MTACAEEELSSLLSHAATPAAAALCSGAAEAPPACSPANARAHTCVADSCQMLRKLTFVDSCCQLARSSIAAAMRSWKTLAIVSELAVQRSAAAAPAEDEESVWRAASGAL